MINIKSLFSILLILLIIDFKNIIAQENGNYGKCKISLLLSGDISDMGYNFMMNDARIRTERLLGIDSIYYENLEQSIGLAEWAIEDSIKQGANLIIVSSNIHTNLGLQMASKYKDKDIYWFIRGRYRPDEQLDKVTLLNFIPFVLHFSLGYFAGLMSKTGIVGFVSPGPPVVGTTNCNTFYMGARAANSSIKFLNINTGSWLNPEVAYKASEFLVQNGADYLGMSQDDMSVQQAIIASGSLGIGETGYPNSKLYGSDIGVSYVTNWTDAFVKYANKVITNTWEPEIYNTTFAEGGSLSMDVYSYRVPINVQTKTNELIEKLKNDSYQPYRCDPFFLNKDLPMDNTTVNCVDDAYFKNTKILLEDKNIKNYGLYTIPLEFVDFTTSFKWGIKAFSIVSIISCLVAMILVVVFRHAKIIRSASPIFCLFILFGCIVIFCSSIIFSQTPSDETCRTRVWLLSAGFTIFLGNLLVKNFRIWLLFDNPKLKKRKITNWKLYPWVCLILAIDVLLLALWTGLGDIRAEQRVGIDGLSKYQYHQVCTNNNGGDIMLYILLVFHGLMLLLACFISFKIKTVDIPEFNESKPISTSIYLITFCLFIIIPLMISPQSVASQTGIICICANFVTLISIVILFGSKFYKMATKGLALNETFASTKSSSFSLSLEKEQHDEDKKEDEFKKSQSSSNQVSRLAHFTSDDSDDEDNNNNNNNNHNNNNNTNDNDNNSLQQSQQPLEQSQQQLLDSQQTDTNNEQYEMSESMKEQDV